MDDLNKHILDEGTCCIVSWCYYIYV